MRDPMSVESRPSRTLAPALGCRWLRHARREGAPQAVAIEQSLYLENASRIIHMSRLEESLR